MPRVEPDHMAARLRTLAAYSACDISDALLKLKVPGAGFLADLIPYAPHRQGSPKLQAQRRVIGPASTVLMVSKNVQPGSTELQGIEQSNIPDNTHYVDLTKPDTIVVTSQPAGQRCAVLGGIMGTRMKMRGAMGAVVCGRIRDLTELTELNFPIWALGTSTVGTGAEAKPWALEVPITVQGITITPGDIIFCDPVEGVVAIPQDKLDAVIDILPQIVGADDNVLKGVRDGMTVEEAFAKYR